jgi:hypothetical protein
MSWEKHQKNILKFPVINGKVQIDQEKLKEPFLWPWAVSRYVCMQCGQTAEIDMDCAQGFIRVMARLACAPEIILERKEDFQKYYFQISYCHNYNCQRTELALKLKE